jgi:hypothetical protein
MPPSKVFHFVSFTLFWGTRRFCKFGAITPLVGTWKIGGAIRHLLGQK